MITSIQLFASIVSGLTKVLLLLQMSTSTVLHLLITIRITTNLEMVQPSSLARYAKHLMHLKLEGGHAQQEVWVEVALIPGYAKARYVCQMIVPTFIVNRVGRLGRVGR